MIVLALRMFHHLFLSAPFEAFLEFSDTPPLSPLSLAEINSGEKGSLNLSAEAE